MSHRERERTGLAAEQANDEILLFAMRSAYNMCLVSRRVTGDVAWDSREI